MKRNSLTWGMALFAAAALVSCQEDISPVAEIVDGNEGNVCITLNVPESMNTTKSPYGDKGNSAMGGLTNVDLANTYDLRYQLAVYRVNGTGSDDFVQAIAPQKKIVDTYQPVTFSMRLTPGRNYKFVVWADFVKQGTDQDLHYATSDFTNITCLDDVSVQLNDESRDAYFITKEIAVGDGPITEDLVLKRPFAKIRIVTTDWLDYLTQKPDNFKIRYYGCERFTNINAVTGSSAANVETLADDCSVEYPAKIDKANKEYSLNYDSNESNRTIVVDYLYTDMTEQTPVHMEFSAFDGTEQMLKRDLKTDIPIQRNYLTTILGNILTVSGSVTVSISENFENYWVVGQNWWDGQDIVPAEPAYDEATKTYTIRTREEFAWLPDNVDAVAGKTVVLGADIDMSGINWKPIYSGKDYTFNGQGHKLRNFTIDGNFGAVYEYKIWNFTIGKYNAYTGVFGQFQGKMMNVTFENISINGLANDKVQYDTDGNAIDHSKEYAYFAGCIGYTGQNWSTRALFENVHARNVRIKSSSKLVAQNVGGLIGWIGTGGGETGLTNCSAQEVTIIGEQAGGLVGQVLAGRGVKFTDCKADDIRIRSTYVKPLYNCLGGFIGYINQGYGVSFKGCTAPTTLEYLFEDTGEPIDYTSDNALYGSCGKAPESIKFE